MKSQVADEGERMNRGEIKFYCVSCGKPMWHKPIKPLPPMTRRISWRKYVGIYVCENCGNERKIMNGGFKEDRYL